MIYAPKRVWKWYYISCPLKVPVPKYRRELVFNYLNDSLVFTSAGSSKVKEDAEFACALTSSTPTMKKKMLKKG